MEKIIIGFDDSCFVCNKFVQFVIKHDSGKTKIKFFPLKSEIFQETRAKYDSIIVFHKSGLDIKHLAIARILKTLKQPYHFLGSLLKLAIPVKIGFYLYDYCAKKRYLIFGESKHCINKNLYNNYFEDS